MNFLEKNTSTKEKENPIFLEKKLNDEILPKVKKVAGIFLSFSNTEDMTSINEFLDAIDYNNLNKYEKKNLEIFLQLSVLCNRKIEAEKFLEHGIDPDCKDAGNLENVPTFEIVASPVFSKCHKPDDSKFIELFFKYEASPFPFHRHFGEVNLVAYALLRKEFEICFEIIKYMDSVDEIFSHFWNKKDPLKINYPLTDLIESKNLELTKVMVRKMNPALVCNDYYTVPLIRSLLKDGYENLIKIFIRYGFNLMDSYTCFTFLYWYQEEGSGKLKLKIEKLEKEVRDEFEILNILLFGCFRDEESVFHYSRFPLDIFKIIVGETGLSFPKSKSVFVSTKRRKVELY